MQRKLHKLVQIGLCVNMAVFGSMTVGCGDDDDDAPKGGDTPGPALSGEFADVVFKLDVSANSPGALEAKVFGLKGNFVKGEGGMVPRTEAGWTLPFEESQLYDDGSDGHEADGETAGNNVWTTVLKFAAPGAGRDPLVYDFGYSLFDDSHGRGWFTGGSIAIASSDAGQVKAASTYKVRPAGTTNLEVTLDIAGLEIEVPSPTDEDPNGTAKVGYDPAVHGQPMLKTDVSLFEFVPMQRVGETTKYTWTLDTCTAIGCKIFGLLADGETAKIIATLGTNADGSPRGDHKAETSFTARLKKGDGDWTPVTVAATTADVDAPHVVVPVD